MRTSTNCYLIALAIADTIKLTNDTFYFMVILLLHTDTQKGIYSYGYLYPYAHYLFSMSVCVTAWLTVSVALERYIMVRCDKNLVLFSDWVKNFGFPKSCTSFLKCQYNFRSVSKNLGFPIPYPQLKYNNIIEGTYFLNKVRLSGLCKLPLFKGSGPLFNLNFCLSWSDKCCLYQYKYCKTGNICV